MGIFDVGQRRVKRCPGIAGRSLQYAEQFLQRAQGFLQVLLQYVYVVLVGFKLLLEALTDRFQRGPFVIGLLQQCALVRLVAIEFLFPGLVLPGFIDSALLHLIQERIERRGFIGGNCRRL